MNKSYELIKESIKRNTKPNSDLKANIWSNIEKELEKNNMNGKRDKKILPVALCVFVACAIVFAIYTPVGKAAVNEFLKIFAKQKDIVVNLEGEDETNESILIVDGKEQSEDLIINQQPEETASKAPEKKIVTYAIYIDNEMYQVESQDDVDIYSPIDYPDDMPPVNMKIYQKNDISVKDAVLDLYNKVKSDFDNIVEPFNVDSPMTGMRFYAYNGDDNGTKETMPQWDDLLRRVYVIDNTVGGVFIIEQNMFVEAEEGHGARMDNMIREFSIID